MKTPYSSICKVSLAVLLASAMGVPAARAQHNQPLANATVPFGFQYGTRSFPAGKYTFGILSDNIMVVRGKSSAALGLVNWSDTDRANRTGKLVFHHTGDQYVLEDIWVPTLAAHLHCPELKQSKHREMAETKAAGSDVEVALLEGVH